MNKARTTAENNTAKHADLVKVTEMMKKNLEQEIQGYRSELSKQEQVGRVDLRKNAACSCYARDVRTCVLHGSCKHPCTMPQVIRSLEREKDKFVLEANETAAKHEQAKELLALRDAAIVDLQKRIAGACRLLEHTAGVGLESCNMAGAAQRCQAWVIKVGSRSPAGCAGSKLHTAGIDNQLQRARPD